MTTLFQESGTDATHGLQFYTSTSGAVTSDSTQARTGPRSLKFDSGAGNATAWAGILSAPTGTAGRMSFGLRVANFPTPATLVIFYLQQTGLTLALRLFSGGEIALYQSSTLKATGAVISTNTWYRFCLVWSGASAKLYKDGVEYIGATTITSSAGNGEMYWGWLNAPGASKVFHVDDLFVDDSSSMTDPGADASPAAPDLRVTAKLPAAENTNSFDTAIGAARGASDYNNVNERPLSLTNGWQHAATSDVQENYTLQAADVGDADLAGATLIARTAWIWAKGAAGGAGTPKIMDNGAETAIVLTSAAKLFTVITDSATYPSNAAGIGMRSTNNADDTFLYECGTLISYAPGVVSIPPLLPRREHIAVQLPCY